MYFSTYPPYSYPQKKLLTSKCAPPETIQFPSNSLRIVITTKIKMIILGEIPYMYSINDLLLVIYNIQICFFNYVMGFCSEIRNRILSSG